MAVKVQTVEQSNAGTVLKTKDHPAGHFLDVDDGHLFVRSLTENTRKVIAIYAPRTWLSAEFQEDAQ